MHNRSALASQPLKIRTAARMVGRKRWPHLIPFCSMKHICDMAWHGMRNWGDFFWNCPKILKTTFSQEDRSGCRCFLIGETEAVKRSHFKLYYCRFNTFLELEMFSQCNDRHQLYCQFNIFLELAKKTSPPTWTGRQQTWSAPATPDPGLQSSTIQVEALRNDYHNHNHHMYRLRYFEIIIHNGCIVWHHLEDFLKT